MHIDGAWFKDEAGRTMLLRGVNLGGDSKVPAWPRAIRPGTFFKRRRVSFVGRPFPLEAADEHFARLRSWGLTFLRLLVPWEAVAHAGPDTYDEDYLNYLEQIVERAAAYGFTLFVDPHQDAWSRLCGGSGAPDWTLEAIGFEPAHFYTTGAATVAPFDEEPFYREWPTNYIRLASATMFTLFFGGDDFAPRTTVGGEPVQSFLQRQYIGAMKQVALRLRDHPNVVGFDTLNEPSPGYIGWRDLSSTDGGPFLRFGPTPSPFQAMVLGDGYSQEVAVWGVGMFGPKQTGTRWLNGRGLRAWQHDRECVWHENGVWSPDGQGRPRLLRPQHFTHVGGRTVDFGRDYLRPFINRYAAEIRSVQPRSIMFVETTPEFELPQWNPSDAPNIANATHWYDMFTLMLRVFIPFFSVDIVADKVILGKKRVLQSFIDQQARIKSISATRLGGVPTILGEFGVPFNMPLGLDYLFNWFWFQEQALDAYFSALETNLLSATIWNYTADNSNFFGDHWNQEDLSIFSRDQERSGAGPDSGGRALPAIVRPYAQRLSGEPLRMAFDLRQKRFDLEFGHDPRVQAPTEIFVPTLHYPRGCHVEVSDGMYELDAERQTLLYWPTPDRQIHQVTLTPEA